MNVSEWCEEFKNFPGADTVVIKPWCDIETSGGARLKGCFRLCSAPPCKGEEADARR